MRLAFARSRKNVELLAGDGRSHWHTELRFSDGQWFSARPRGGVDFRWFKLPARYNYIDFALTGEEEATVRAWCETVVGQPFDFEGYRGGGCHPGKWWCSEVVCTALQQIGLFADVDVCKLHASEFWVLANRLL
jgi:uncharacterized protein YycO